MLRQLWYLFNQDSWSLCASQRSRARFWQLWAEPYNDVSKKEGVAQCTTKVNSYNKIWMYFVFICMCYFLLFVFFKLCLWLFFCKNFMKKFLEKKKLKQDRPNQSHCLFVLVLPMDRTSTHWFSELSSPAYRLPLALAVIRLTLSKPAVLWVTQQWKRKKLEYNPITPTGVPGQCSRWLQFSVCLSSPWQPLPGGLDKGAGLKQEWWWVLLINQTNQSRPRPLSETQSRWQTPSRKLCLFCGTQDVSILTM